MYPIRRLVLLFGLVVTEIAFAQSAISALEQNLVRIDRFIAETQAELEVALAGYDQAAIQATGERIRELKRRRARTAQELAVANEQQRQHEAGALRRLRPELMRRLEAIEPQVEKAATAFDEQRTPSRGGTLRALTVEEIGIQEDLSTANAAAREGGAEDAGDDAVIPAPGAKP